MLCLPFGVLVAMAIRDHFLRGCLVDKVHYINDDHMIWHDMRRYNVTQSYMIW